MPISFPSVLALAASQRMRTSKRKVDVNIRCKNVRAFAEFHLTRSECRYFFHLFRNVLYIQNTHTRSYTDIY